jgi:cytochrome c oxidase cbb3-type subunit 3
MPHRHTIAAACALVACIALAACEREERTFQSVPPVAIGYSSVSMSTLQPGPPRPQADVKNPVEESAYAVAEGQRLFNAYNCAGCHFHGGGGIGPPLMDNEWIYGSAPQNIYATIVEGRPNGMPSFRGKIAAQQVWEIVAYVRSLSGLLRKDVEPARSDEMQVTTQPASVSREQPKASFVPPSTARP